MNRVDMPGFRTTALGYVGTINDEAIALEETDVRRYRFGPVAVSFGHSYWIVWVDGTRVGTRSSLAEAYKLAEEQAA